MITIKDFIFCLWSTVSIWFVNREKLERRQSFLQDCEPIFKGKLCYEYIMVLYKLRLWK